MDEHNLVKLESVLRIANNALYFADSSDYASALYEICVAITGDMEYFPYKYMDVQEDV